jgi:AcrR family transcriptional regulator
LAETDGRLLQAAGEVFAEVGFRRATIREICRRADANVAAVNYHFGDKGRLYATVIKYGVGMALRKYPPDQGLPPDGSATPEQRLRAFVRSFLFRLLEQGPYAWHGRVMMWELIEPSGILGELFPQLIRPLYQRLESIVADLLGPGATPERIRLGCASVLGQCTFYRTGAEMLAHVQPGSADPSPERIEALVDHVARFTAAGLRSYAVSAPEGANRP